MTIWRWLLVPVAVVLAAEIARWIAQHILDDPGDDDDWDADADWDGEDA